MRRAENFDHWRGGQCRCHHGTLVRAAAELGDIVLLDIPQTEGMPSGKAGFDLNASLADHGLRLQDHRHPRLRRHGRQRGGGDHGRHRPQAGNEPRRFAGDQRQDRRQRGRAGGQAQPRSRDHRGQQSAGRDGAAGLAGEQVSAAAGVGPGRRARHGPLSHVFVDGAGRQRRGHFGPADGRPWRHDGADCQLHVGRRHSAQPVDRLRAAGSTKSSIARAMAEPKSSAC